ncbi:MAG: hypothetical protein IPP61_00200 [Cytophagaceae bacterium]|nr:hypothetical protein [Cytophagaceae bacterium]MBL0323600.1 hypothetical protein [Cytophagaceae bacterium]
MALRDQPYLPLYIQDFMTDEKLIECSASTTGVYIRIMCLMHKSEDYGKILLKQKYKQTEKQSLNFATQLAKSLPYNLGEIEQSIEELLNEKVLEIRDDFLIQKRMVKDNDISLKRSISGSKGGISTQNKDKKPKRKFAKPKSKANSENENENENEIEIENGIKIDYENFILFWNKKVEKSLIPKIDKLTDKRKKSLRILFSEFSKEKFAEVLNIALKSDFLTGKTKEGFVLTFDFFSNKNNFIKVMEGNYANKEKSINETPKIVASTQHYEKPLEPTEEEKIAFRKENGLID